MIEKYNIINYDGATKTVTVLSESGRVERINESEFMNKFVKLKDAALRLIKKGGELLTELGGKIIGMITPIHAAKSEDPCCHVKLSDDMIELAQESGIDVNPDTLTEELDKEEEAECSDESVSQMCARFIYRLLESIRINDAKAVTEAVVAPQPFKRDVPFGASGSRVQVGSNGEVKPEGKAVGTDLSSDGRGVSIQPLRSWLPQVPDYDYDEVVRDLRSKFKRVFKTPITGDSAITCQAQYSLAYKPLFIYGAPGIGKTQIIRSIVEEFSGSEFAGGKKVNFVHLVCNAMNEYSIFAPATVKERIRKTNKFGNPMISANGKVTVLDNDSDTNRMNTIFSNNIPSYEYIPYEDIEGDVDAERIKQKNIENDENAGYGVIFIDEYSRINEPELQQAIAQLIQQRSAGDHVLGTHWAIVVASNLPQFHSEKANGEMAKLWNSAEDNMQKQILYNLHTDPALNQRFDFCNYVPTYERWRAWAEKHGINKFVLDFLDSPLFRFQWYNTFDLVDANQGATISSPRKWEEFSQAVDWICEEYDIENYLDVKDAKKFINDVQTALMKYMPYVAKSEDMKNFGEDELINISQNDCKNVWTNPSAITFNHKETGKALMKNIRLNASGRPYGGTPENLADRIYTFRPEAMHFKSKADVDNFSLNEKKYMDKVADFVFNFYGEYLHDSVKGYSFSQDSNIGYNQLHPSHLGQVCAFVERLMDLIRTDAQKASGKQVLNSQLFGSADTYSFYDDRSLLGTGERSRKFSVLYAKCEQYNQK